MTSHPFVNPRTHEPLVVDGASLVDAATGAVVAPIVDGIARFVPSEDYAASFGWQWKQWTDTLSDARSGQDAKSRLLLERTHFDRYAMEGRDILECGMGGGDDTEVLLTLPFGEVHAFDLSTAVERAGAYLSSTRLVLSQASIFEIPYADQSFDFVFCHRVIQHTPDPEAALRAVCRKVAPGGVLFAHCYKRSWRNMMSYKYKYRWLTRRLPHERVHGFVTRHGERLHRLQLAAVRRGRVTAFVASSFVPFEQVPAYQDVAPNQLLDVARLCTFDALTPRFDRPMTTRRFTGVIDSEGLRVEFLHDPKVSPLWCTAVRPR